jgi:hypothetical protein
MYLIVFNGQKYTADYVTTLRIQMVSFFVLLIKYSFVPSLPMISLTEIQDEERLRDCGASM